MIRIGKNTRPKEHSVTCLCGSPMRLRYSAKFPKKPWFYGCDRYPKCKATHGCHQESGAPLGRPADKETKAWRIKAHEALDFLWKKAGWTRQEAYEWMRKTLSLTPEENHIGMMDAATCCRVIEEVERLKGTMNISNKEHSEDG